MSTEILFRVILKSFGNRGDDEATKVSIDRWIDKEEVVHIYN